MCVCVCVCVLKQLPPTTPSLLYLCTVTDFPLNFDLLSSRPRRVVSRRLSGRSLLPKQTRYQLKASAGERRAIPPHTGRARACAQRWRVAIPCTHKGLDTGVSQAQRPALVPCLHLRYNADVNNHQHS